ncbi:MAG: hypothetical protein IJ165_03045, partial [Proteobacteria bacterium]|nr:hypothetical protein [Pseudomonadota bacterium]
MQAFRLSFWGVFIRQNGCPSAYTDPDGASWAILSPIERSIKAKIEAVGTPLKDWDIQINYGIKTGCNEAFIIDEAKRNEILNRCQTEDERTRTDALIRPILRGRDIKRYKAEWAGLYVILAKFGSHKYLEADYPAIFAHLKQYEDKLKSRGQVRYTSSGRVRENGEYPGQHHWLELDNNPSDEYLDDFNKQKVMWKIIGCNISFIIDKEGFYCNNAVNIMTGQRQGLIQFIGLMNSQLFDWYLKISTEAEVQGDGVQLYSTTLEKMPVMLNFPQSFTKAIEARLNEKLHDKELDDMIFELYHGSVHKSSQKLETQHQQTLPRVILESTCLNVSSPRVLPIVSILDNVG